MATEQPSEAVVPQLPVESVHAPTERNSDCVVPCDASARAAQRPLACSKPAKGGCAPSPATSPPPPPPPGRGKRKRRRVAHSLPAASEDTEGPPSARVPAAPPAGSLPKEVDRERGRRMAMSQQVAFSFQLSELHKLVARQRALERGAGRQEADAAGEAAADEARAKQGAREGPVAHGMALPPRLVLGAEQDDANASTAGGGMDDLMVAWPPSKAMADSSLRMSAQMAAMARAAATQSPHGCAVPGAPRRVAAAQAKEAALDFSLPPRVRLVETNDSHVIERVTEGQEGELARPSNAPRKSRSHGGRGKGSKAGGKGRGGGDRGGGTETTSISNAGGAQVPGKHKGSNPLLMQQQMRMTSLNVLHQALGSGAATLAPQLLLAAADELTASAAGMGAAAGAQPPAASAAQAQLAVTDALQQQLYRASHPASQFGMHLPQVAGMPPGAAQLGAPMPVMPGVPPFGAHFGQLAMPGQMHGQPPATVAASPALGQLSAIQLQMLGVNPYLAAATGGIPPAAGGTPHMPPFAQLVAPQAVMPPRSSGFAPYPTPAPPQQPPTN